MNKFAKSSESRHKCSNLGEHPKLRAIDFRAQVSFLAGSVDHEK